MMQEYEKKHEQDTIVLPISCVRDNGFDPETFLEATGMQWNQCIALKLLEIVISVFENLDKKCKLVYGFWAQLSGLFH